MTQVTVEEARANLDQLIREAVGGEEIVLLKDDRPVARLVPVIQTHRPRARFGSGKGQVLYMAPDFDAELDDFKEYMP